MNVNYWILDPNAYRRPIPRWLLPSSMSPQYDEQIGIKGFKRRVGNREIVLAPEQVLYVWLPSLSAEVGPGVAPAVVALHAAGVLRNTDAYVEGYFARGAIKATLLQIDGHPGQAEKAKLEAWWKRMIGGLKNAYETVAISAAVKPIVIGDGLKDTINKDLTDQKRQDIAVAFGIPMSLLWSQAANHAVAYQDVVNFYDQTIIPDAELIQDAVNDQWLSRVGMRIQFQPEKLEVYQTKRVEEAKAIKELTGGPVLTRDEGRALLGYGPWPEDPLPPAPATPEAAQLATERASEEVQAAVDQLETKAATLPAPPAAPTAEQPAGDVVSTDDITSDSTDDSTAAKAADLDRWQRKALKALKSGKSAAVRFESTDIPIDDAHAIEHNLAHVGAGDADAVKHLFAAYKAALELTDTEQALYDRIAPILAKHGTAIRRQIERGETVTFAQLDADLQAALLPAIVEHVLEQATALAEDIGPDFDPADMATAASAWAQTYTFELVKSLNERTRSVVQSAVSQYMSTPGMTREQLERLMSSAFSPARAESIAVTEITRAAAAGVHEYQRLLAEAGIEMERVNRTNADDKTCQLCGPLNGKAEDAWPNSDGPPWHVRCRCAVSLRIKKGTTP